MKKKTFLTPLLLLAAVLPAPAQVTYTLHGRISGLPTASRVFLIKQEGNDTQRVDSATVTDGTFTIAGTIKRQQLCSLAFYLPGDDSHRYARRKVNIYVDAEPITLVSDTATLFSHDLYDTQLPPHLHWEGSAANKAFQQYLTATTAERWTADSASFAEAEAWLANEGDDDKIKKYKARKEAAKKACREAEDRWLFAHPNDACTAAILAGRVHETFQHTASDFDRYLDVIKDNPDTAHVNFLRSNLDIAKRYALGNRYTDFTAKQPDNKTATLSSLMRPGTYTLIDFWASWCGPCRAAIPKVKAMAKEHAANLTVISCSADEHEAAWRKAMAEEKMPWAQLILTKDVMDKVCQAYQINSIPRLVLIDPQGNIVVITHDPAIIKGSLSH